MEGTLRIVVVEPVDVIGTDGFVLLKPHTLPDTRLLEVALLEAVVGQLAEPAHLIGMQKAIPAGIAVVGQLIGHLR